MAGDAGVRDKDGFLIPQSPGEVRDNLDSDVTADDDSEVGDVSVTTEEEDDSLATENSAHSRDS